MKKFVFITLGIVVLFVLLLAFGTKKTSDNDKESDALVHINMDDYNDMIEDKKDFVLIISQLGCSHCEKFLPIARKVAQDNKIKVYDLNLTNLSSEDQKKIIDTYGATGTPTIIFMKKGKEANKTDRLNGAVSEEKFETKLKDLKYIK